jgi:hypothetical protein
MCIGHDNRINLISAVIIGLLIGAIEATLWIFGDITKVRFIIPYATADALLIFALTPILAILSNRSDLARIDEGAHCSGQHLSPYVKTIMISTAVFLIFVQIFVGTLIPFSIKGVLAFVGSFSFWVMLTAFISMVFYLVRKK